MRIHSVPETAARSLEDAEPNLRVVPLRESMIVPRTKRVSQTVSSALVDVLASLGVTHAFGVLGGAIVPFCRAVEDGDIELVHFRHESGAAFAAAEASLASGKPVVVFATTGPGITNALTGILAARWEGAKVILVSGATSSAERGKWAFQETGALAGTAQIEEAFHFTTSMESAAELPQVARRLASGVTRPGGFVAHVRLPIAIQMSALEEKVRSYAPSIAPPGPSMEAISEVRALLTQTPFAIWVGHGARGAAAEILTLAEQSGAPVMCSPRAKGIFPEDHPQFIGVTGMGGNPAIEERFARTPPAHVLVLGTRLGESTSYWRKEFVPTESFVHVDVDADVFGAAYPEATTIGVQSEIGEFLRSLLADWPAISQEQLTGRETTSIDRPKLTLTMQPRGLIRPQALMQAIQHAVIDESESIVIAEAGNSFLWATELLRFQSAGRYRVSSGFGSMGHATTGVLGASIGSGYAAVAIVGDGAMLMQNELSTAVQYGIPAVWVVLNDGQYAMVRQGMQNHGFGTFGTEIPRTDFVMMARSMGAAGLRVDDETKLEGALRLARTSGQPFVLDIRIEENNSGPVNRRVKSLTGQFADSDGEK